MEKKSVLKIPLFFVCVAALLFSVPCIAEPEDTAEELDACELARKVFTMGCEEINEIKLESWGQISNRIETPEELKAKYECIVEEFKLDGEMRAVQAEKDGFCSISHLEAKEEGFWQITLQTVPMSAEAGGTYWGIMFATDQPQDAKAIYHKLRSFLAAGHIFPEKGSDKDEIENVLREIGITMTGCLPGKLEKDACRKLADKMAAVVKAEYVEGVYGGTFAGYSYYTGSCSHSLLVDGKRLNLNVAMRYNEVDNETYLYVGVPLVYQDY